MNRILQGYNNKDNDDADQTQQAEAVSFADVFQMAGTLDTTLVRVETAFDSAADGQYRSHCTRSF